MKKKPTSPHSPSRLIGALDLSGDYLLPDLNNTSDPVPAGPPSFNTQPTGLGPLAFHSATKIPRKKSA